VENFKTLWRPVTDQEVIDQILSVPRHYSASYLVDLGNTCPPLPTITASGGAFLASGGASATSYVGTSVDMLHYNSFCNMVVTGIQYFQSGQLRIQVQTADTDTSGSYTDPTSGLAQLPTSFSSGGILILNSGGAGNGTFGAFVSGQAMLSGFSVSAGFQRIQRFVRAVTFSGTNDFYAGTLTVAFVSNLKTTGSGGGTSQQPGSGVIAV
jgi:hypothetical protein